MKPGTYFAGPDLRIAALEGQNKALAARVVALETALNGVLSVVDIPQSGPTVCMSSEDAIRSACNGLDLQLAVSGAKAILEERDEVRR